MAKLTAAERRILSYPPTSTTWLCGRKNERLDGAKCDAVNSGSSHVCWMCRKEKPRKPKLLWPTYVAACKKAGIEPGTRWRPAPTPDAPKPRRATRKKGA